jgi:hypothetical protein
MEFFLLFGNAQVLMPLILIGIILCERNFLSPAMLLLFTMIFSTLLKFIFAIPYSPELVAKLGKNGFSFPSGHMQSTFVFYGWFIIATNNKLLRLILSLIILAEGVALIYEGYHNIYDVLGAVVFAGLTIIFYKTTVFLIEKNFSKVPEKLIGTILILVLSIFLIIILAIFYQIPSHLYMILYSITGVNFALLSSVKEHNTKIINLLLILLILFILTIICSIVSFNPVFLKEIKWIFISSMMPFLAILARKSKQINNFCKCI